MYRDTSKLHIAFVMHVHPDPSQTFINVLVESLMSRGHEVDVYCLHSTNSEPGTPRQGPYGERVISWEPNNRLLKLLRLPSNIRRSVKRIQPSRLYALWHQNPRVALHLVHAAAILSVGLSNRPDYDIIHAQWGPTGILGLYLRDAGLMRGRLVTSFRGSDLTSYVKRHGASVYRDLFERGDLFLPVSEEFRRRLIEYGCPADKIRVFRSAIDLSKFHYSPRQRADRGTLRVLTVARLVEKKGIDYALRGIALFRKRHPDVQLQYRIVGHGPLTDKLKKLSFELDLAGQVEFVGRLAHERVIEELGRADVFLLPSITSRTGDEEGVPNALKEAMACGVPVISTRHSGIPELVRDRVSGLLVAERDAEAIADALAELWCNPELGLRLAGEARRTVEADYSLSRLILDLEDQYRSLLA